MQVEEIECMKIKKKVIRYAIGGMIVLWLLLGLFARRGALYVMGDGRSVLSRSDDDVPCFGIGFYSMPKDSNYIRWLNESECKVLWQQILSGEKDGIGAYIGCLHMYGRLYVYPRWVDSLGLKTLLIPLQPRVEIIYTPSKNYLYLSEDCSELSYDCFEGLSVEKISPELLGVDISTMVKHFSDVGVKKENYRDVVEMLNEKRSAGETTDN